MMCLQECWTRISCCFPQAPSFCSQPPGKQAGSFCGGRMPPPRDRGQLRAPGVCPSSHFPSATPPPPSSLFCSRRSRRQKEGRAGWAGAPSDLRAPSPSPAVSPPYPGGPVASRSEATRAEDSVGGRGCRTAPPLTILDKQIKATLSCRPEGDSATQPDLFFLETLRNPVRASARFQQGPVRCFRSHQINSLFI